jgi:hypothetical protein
MSNVSPISVAEGVEKTNAAFTAYDYSLKRLKAEVKAGFRSRVKLDRSYFIRQMAEYAGARLEDALNEIDHELERKQP